LWSNRIDARRWLLLAVLLLALALRLFRLDGQSLWYDEGTSVALAGRDLATITRSAAADIHPPFYYYLLHSWTALAGFSPSGVRALSALLGTALVGVTWALGRQLYGAGVGLVAALFAAVSPFAVYYSQETRMYILVAALGALSTWLAGELVLGNYDSARRQPPRALHLRVWIAYIATSGLVLYTHYFGFTVLLAQSVAIVAWWLAAARHRTRFVLRWAAAQVVVGLLYLPWLWLTWQQIQGWPAVSEPFSLAFLARDTLRVFSLGLSVAGSSAWLWAFAALLILGAAAAMGWSGLTGRPGVSGARESVWPRLMPVLYLAVPVATMYVLSLRRPLYNPKFLLLALPPFHLLLAAGAATLGQWVPNIWRRWRPGFRNQPQTALATQVVVVSMIVIGLMVPTARSLHNYYFDAQFARDDYRGIARFVEAISEPKDAVVLNAPGQIEIFDYYYDGRLAQYPLPRQRPPVANAVRKELAAIVDRHDRIFGVFWATDESDPEGIVESWLNEHAYEALDEWYGNVRLVLYATPPAEGAAVVQPIDAQLGASIQLQRALLGGRSVVAGDVLTLTLDWSATADIERRYKVFVQLLSPGNQLIAQRDAEPGGGHKPTDTWEPGSTVVDRYGLWIPPGTPPAAYRLIVGMYDPQSGQRLAVTQASQASTAFVDLGTLRVVAPDTPPSTAALGLDATVNCEYGPLTLLGYSLDKRGAEGQPRAPWHPGDTARITLYWRARSRPETAPRLALQLVSSRGVMAETSTTPTEGLYPAPQWPPGQVVRDPHDLPLPADLTPGRYELRVTTADASGQRLGPPTLVPVVVTARPS
jgi:mannosyltransferase